MGIYGEILDLLSNPVEISPQSSSKTFELGRARSKTNIAENSFALGHATHNKYLTANKVTPNYLT